MQNRYHGPQFMAICGTTHGGIAPPALFNVVVDSVIHHWISIMVYDGTVIHNRLGHAVGRSLGVF